VAARKTPPTEPEELDRCRSCPSRLVYPLRCRRLGRDVWQLELRCPDCGAVWKDKRSTSEVRGFDKALAASREALLGHLQEIERIEREDEIERFCSALEVDAILPEDFAH
jgi:hypothetical protein